eukprot:scaffold53603_cov38-Prasinocladus_malaysianus.AAC.2
MNRSQLVQLGETETVYPRIIGYPGGPGIKFWPPQHEIIFAAYIEPLQQHHSALPTENEKKLFRFIE